MQKKINFLENKIPNFENIKKIYQKSIKINHHANFGPVSKILESKLKKILKLPKNKSVIMCSSATMGLLIICNYLRLHNKNKSIFATSNCTFFSSNLNFLSNSKILPTNEKGLISKKYIEKKLSTFSDLIYTNLFNQDPYFNEIYNLCKKYKKNLIIDNATNLLDRPKNYNKMNIYEVISFHHTKPWGFGEGGMIVCNDKHEKKIRELINFGSKNFLFDKHYSFNAKISDWSCSVILDRINNYNKWSLRYQNQYKRVKKIIFDNFNFYKILDKQTKSPKNYIAIICNKTVDNNLLKKTKYLEFKKYYRPLSKSLKNCNAKKIYENILCVPCHNDLIKISNKKIINDLSLFIDEKK
tara:strand:+ start:81 stop:1145 length:1065 start_codon:yes stop_codon:yes gene_type:complete